MKIIVTDKRGRIIKSLGFFSIMLLVLHIYFLYIVLDDGYKCVFASVVDRFSYFIFNVFI